MVQDGFSFSLSSLLLYLRPTKFIEFLYSSATIEHLVRHCVGPL